MVFIKFFSQLDCGYTFLGRKPTEIKCPPNIQDTCSLHAITEDFDSSPSYGRTHKYLSPQDKTIDHTHEFLFYFFLLWYMICMSPYAIPCYFNYCSFTTSFEVGAYKSSISILFPKFFGILGLFALPFIFGSFVNFLKEHNKF